MKKKRAITDQQNITRRHEPGVQIVWKVSNAVDAIATILLLILCIYGIYVVWDTKQIYQEAGNSKYEQYKPEAENSLSFEELKKINEDVFAWVTVYGTKIDYPVAQGRDNQQYINSDIMGKYTLAGSIYLDSFNQKDFSDFNSIIYGHHMEKSAMFGDLDKFAEKSIFDSHLYGNLYYDGKDHGLEFFAFLLADAYDWTLYNPAIQGSEAARTEYLNYILEQAEYTRDIGITANDRIVLLSTCAAEPTNGRHILVGRLTDTVFEDTFYSESEDDKQRGIDAQSLKTWIERVPMIGWMIGLILLMLILIVLIRMESSYSRKRQQKDECEKNVEM